MTRPPEKKKPRLRVRYRNASGKWYAAVLDVNDVEIDVSPPGTEQDAEHYMKTYRRYGAWQRS